MLRAAELLEQGQPSAHVARAQQAAHDAVCKQGPQAGAPGAVVTNTTFRSIPPSSVRRWSPASPAARQRAVKSRQTTALRASVLRLPADSTGPRAWRAPLAPACAPHNLKSHAERLWCTSALYETQQQHVGTRCLLCTGHLAIQEAAPRGAAPSSMFAEASSLTCTHNDAVITSLRGTPRRPL